MRKNEPLRGGAVPLALFPFPTGSRACAIGLAVLQQV